MAKRAYSTWSAEPAAGDDASPAPSRTLIERAYAQLREDIIEGQLPPGEKLRVEHLKSRYAVGAGTLREAITRLVSDALVEAEGQRGFRVSAIALDDLADITNLRVQIETDALRQSIRRGDGAWRQQLQKAYDDVSGVEQPLRPQARARWEAMNARFHDALVAAHVSPWTTRVLRLLARHGERYRRYAIGLPDTGRDVHAEHRAIFEAAMRGQEARAALALEAHIRATPELLEAHWRTRGLPAG
jgi:DNA-binding GntR family transcriptional regulator